MKLPSPADYPLPCVLRSAAQRDAWPFLLQRELKEIAKDTLSGVSVELVGNNIRKMKGCVEGACSHLLSLSLPHSTGAAASCMQSELPLPELPLLDATHKHGRFAIRNSDTVRAALLLQHEPPLLLLPILQAQRTRRMRTASSTSTSSSVRPPHHTFPAPSITCPYSYCNPLSPLPIPACRLSHGFAPSTSERVALWGCCAFLFRRQLPLCAPKDAFHHESLVRSSPFRR